MKQQEAEIITPAVPSFYDQLQVTVPSLRAALIEVLVSVGADPAKPQDLSRRFGLNKNLTWKISKTVGGSDFYAAVPHIPGSAGVEIFLRALAKAGAPAHLVEDVRQVARDFERVVKVHTGDRATLEAMINSRLPVSQRSEQAELNRKKAYQANSGIWGARARTQLAMNVLAPSADQPEMADLVQVGGLEGFRRLRSDARWLLFRRERWSDDDPHPGPDRTESLDPDFPADKGVPLLGEFCSKPIPDIEVISDAGEDQYELPPGPVGNMAAFTCIYGQVVRDVGSTVADAEGEYSEIGSNLITPVENFLFDMLVHRDFEWAMNPEVVIYSRMDGGALHASARRTRNLLPVIEPVHDLGWGTAALATPLLPTYPKLVRAIFGRLEWDPNEFHAFRFAMTYPPIPTAALLRSKLPVRAS